MFLSYFDSSGNPGFTDQEDYVLASVIIREDDWRYVDGRINEIKKKHFPGRDPDSVELHVKDMVDHNGVYEYMDVGKIHSFLDDVFEFLSDAKTPLVIIASLIKKNKIYPKVDMELWNYKFVFERFDLYMAKNGSIDTNVHGCGVVIIDDEKGGMNQALYNKLAALLRTGTGYVRLEHIVEWPFFTDSKRRNMIQICDCVSYCIRKKHRSGNMDNFSTRRWQKYYSMMEKKFHSKNGKYLGYGLKIFP